MTIHETLQDTEHRPWKLPAKSWKFYQEWNDVIFLHWEVELDQLQKHVPKELKIDLFAGKPWVSVVAFKMNKIRPKNLPSFPPISDFDEINIRTYIKSNKKSGVYFLSIEGGARLSCIIAKAISRLPYRYSKIIRTDNHFESINSQFDEKLKINFQMDEKIDYKSKLDKWLTERYALFQDTEKSINTFEIHHLEWEINKIKLFNLSVSYPRFEKLLTKPPDKAHYSKGVKVLAWGKEEKVRTSYGTM
ncbi:MAG: DUF2071 domain-containing protein [Saprospiraceae bacterium]|nr:DUF2071 domain-containing protein [Saprospiraceae bacterium]|tara:strand:+ start:256 stop:996 length:741 start_codon:yes stop_codon:yes gene_type:complete